MTGGWPDPLSLIHNKAVLLSQLSSQAALVTLPILSALQEREEFLKEKLERLRQVETDLGIQLRELEEDDEEDELL